MKNKLLRSFIIISGFLLYKNSKYVYAYLVFGREKWIGFNTIYPASIMLFTGILIAFLVNYAINRRFSLDDFGLKKNFFRGLLMAVIFTLPMFIGYGILCHFKFSFSWEIFYKATFLAGFGEEFIYRAFLFGLLFYFAGWGFLTAGIFTGLFFGWAHIYQAEDIHSAIGIFLFTCGASLGFAWFYYAWKSLWMLVFLHGLMDLAWDISLHDELASNVLGSPWVNVFRFATLLAAVIYSVYYSKKNGTYDLKQKLWKNQL